MCSLQSLYSPLFSSLKGTKEAHITSLPPPPLYRRGGGGKKGERGAPFPLGKNALEVLGFPKPLAFAFPFIVFWAIKKVQGKVNIIGSLTHKKVAQM